MVGLAVSGLAIVLLLQQISVAQLGQVLSRAQLGPLLVLVAAVAASIVTRALRWGVFFRPDRRVPFGPLLSTLTISYMASTFLPFRAGELVRAVFLGQREAIPVPRVVGTILIEKLFDFLAIGTILLLVLATTPLPPPATVAGSSIALAVFAGFGFVVALAVWRSQTLALVAWTEKLVPFGLGERVRLVQITRQFATGTDSLRSGRLWLPMLGWTAVTWGAGVLSAWAGAAAVGVYPSLAALGFLMVLTSVGQSVPSSPGYVGVYHAAAVLALTSLRPPYNADIDASTALAVALITHAMTYGSLVIAGLVAMWLGGYGIRDVLAARQQAPSVAQTTAPVTRQVTPTA